MFLDVNFVKLPLHRGHDVRLHLDGHVLRQDREQQPLLRILIFYQNNREREGEYFIVKASQELMEKVNSFIQILKSHHRLFFAVKNVVI